MRTIEFKRLNFDNRYVVNVVAIATHEYNNGEQGETLWSKDGFVFAFIGGGRGKVEIEERASKLGSRLLVLPYQPLERIKYSLSAADVQIVSFGDEMIGIVHPCKFYAE